MEIFFRIDVNIRCETFLPDVSFRLETSLFSKRSFSGLVILDSSGQGFQNHGEILTVLSGIADKGENATFSILFIYFPRKEDYTIS